jgi:hypothetical protein
MVLKVDVPAERVRGDVDVGYGPIADGFRCNLADRGEVGAAWTLCRDSRKVIDLWGGYGDGVTRAPWREDTAVTMFSAAKGVVPAVANAQGSDHRRHPGGRRR